MSFGDVDTIISELGVSLGLIKHKKVLSKAKELMRRSNSKSPSIGASEFCKPCACIYLAFENYDKLELLDVDKMIMSVAGNATKMFYNAVKLIQNQLGIPRHRTVAQVIANIPDIKLNIPEYIEQTEHLLELYKKKFVGGDTQLQKQYLDFENVEFTCAALYTMLQQNNVNPDSFINKILIQCKMVDKNEFDRIVKDIKNYCYDGLTAPQAKSPAVSKPKLLPLLKVNHKRQRQEVKVDTENSNSLNLLTDTIENEKKDVDSTTSTPTPTSEPETAPSSAPVIDLEATASLSTVNNTSHTSVVNIDGSLSIQEERAMLKKKRDDSYQEWCSKVIEDNSKTSTAATTNLKQSDISTFFCKK